jgi:Zn-dependent protease with chaperone function
MALDPRLVSPKERRLFLVGAVFSGLAWLAVVVSLIGLLYAALGALFFLAAHALYLAHVRTNGVRIDERQLPDLHARVRAAASRLGLQALPDVYVVNGGGLLNAFATKLLSRPCRFSPRLARQPVLSAGDAPGVAIRVSPDGVF